MTGELLGSWGAGMNAGVWEYKTTLDGRVFFDLGEAQRHFSLDLDRVGDLWVRPMGEVEWGWHQSGSRITDHPNGSGA